MLFFPILDLNYKYTAVEMGGDESCVVRRHAVLSRMREVGFETRFRNAHYYFCLKPGRQGAGVLSLSRRFPRKCIEEITPLSLKPSKMCHWTFRKSRWPRVN